MPVKVSKELELTFEPLLVNLREGIPKDRREKGVIGEHLAALYLEGYGIDSLVFAGESALPDVGSMLPAHTFFEYFRRKPKWLTWDQTKYLRRIWLHGHQRWDLIGITGPQGLRYVIEVKFKMHSKSLSYARLPTRNDILMAERADFVPLLLIVQGLENWTFQISCMRLSSSERVPLHPPRLVPQGSLSREPRRFCSISLYRLVETVFLRWVKEQNPAKNAVQLKADFTADPISDGYVPSGFT
jgi:hypothetical protein